MEHGHTENYITALRKDVVVIIWLLDLIQRVQSVLITTKVVSSNPVQDEMYSIQHHVIQFVNDLRQVWFSPGTPVSSTNKTDRHDATEILLKVALMLMVLWLFVTLALIG